MSEWEDAEELEWSRFHGSVSQFIGETLMFELRKSRFELRFQDSVLGIISRPDDAYLAETEDGSWRFTHPGMGFKRVVIEDARSELRRGEYERRVLGAGGNVRMSGGELYALRRDGHPLWALGSGGQPWRLTGGDGTHIARFELGTAGSQIQIRLLADAPALGLLMLVCGYVLAVDGESHQFSYGGSGPGGG